MRVVINDANILIDLAKLELLDVFSQLNFELHSTDFVLAELNKSQRVLIDKLILDNVLNIIKTEDIDDFNGISSLLERTNGLSFEDCSVWYYSKKMNGILLTGDGKLRKQARKDEIEVKGIIYIFDELLAQGLISYEIAILRMRQLIQLNMRLPEAEIEKRLIEWELKNNLG